MIPRFRLVYLDPETNSYSPVFWNSPKGYNKTDGVYVDEVGMNALTSKSADRHQLMAKIAFGTPHEIRWEFIDMVREDHDKI